MLNALSEQSAHNVSIVQLLFADPQPRHRSLCPTIYVSKMPTLCQHRLSTDSVSKCVSLRPVSRLRKRMVYGKTGQANSHRDSAACGTSCAEFCHWLKIMRGLDMGCQRRQMLTLPTEWTGATNLRDQGGTANRDAGSQSNHRQRTCSTSGANSKRRSCRQVA